MLTVGWDVKFHIKMVLSLLLALAIVLPSGEILTECMLALHPCPGNVNLYSPFKLS